MKQKLQFDIILAVDECKPWHKLNLHSNVNKHHYTYFARFTHGRAVNLAQRFGAKVHFNEMKMTSEEFAQRVDLPDEEIKSQVGDQVVSNQGMTM